MRLVILLLAAALCWPAHAQVLRVKDVVDGFEKTVFGAEFAGPLGFTQTYMRRFEGPVRAAIIDTSRRRGRTRQVRNFLRYLNGKIGPLKIRIVSDPAKANLRIYIVDRRDYASVVRDDVFRSRFATVRGRCVVRSQFTRAGIASSSAVIVSDEGNALFRRCMAEEIMQALGPLNDDTSLARSMFNDASRYTAPQRFDLLILRMLYDPTLKSGMTLAQMRGRLPGIARRSMRAVPPG